MKVSLHIDSARYAITTLFLNIFSLIANYFKYFL